ncbi:MAG: DUF4230 domain-containing protein [Flavobacteriaceae bacterium]
MRNIIFGVLITLVVLFTFKYCDTKRANEVVLQENSALIQEQIKQVGKLVVTEGHFSQVFNYRNSKEVFGEYFQSEKKALVIVNADVTVSYDLSKIEFEIDEAHKILRITNIPKEDIKISPDLEYYDVQSGFFNPFEAQDYNIIKKKVVAALEQKMEQSDLKKNAQNRLISELSKFYILTHSLGWTLEHNQTVITNTENFQNITL